MYVLYKPAAQLTCLLIHAVWPAAAHFSVVRQSLKFQCWREPGKAHRADRQTDRQTGAVQRPHACHVEWVCSIATNVVWLQ